MNRKNFFKEYWYNPATSRAVFRRKLRMDKRIAKGKYVGEDQLRSARNAVYRASLKTNATRAEIIFGDFLWNNKIYFQFQKGFFKPFHRIVDFYLPDHSLIVEIDGSSHDETKQKDYTKDRRWEKERYRGTLRITNDEVFDGTFKEKLKWK